MKQVHVNRRMGMVKGPDPVDGVGMVVGIVLFFLIMMLFA